MRKSAASKPAVYVQIDASGQVGLFAVGPAPVIEVSTVPEPEIWRKSGKVDDQHVATLHLKLDGRSILEVRTFDGPEIRLDEQTPAFYGDTPAKAAATALGKGMNIAEKLAALIEETRRNPQKDAWLIFGDRLVTSAGGLVR